MHQNRLQAVKSLVHTECWGSENYQMQGCPVLAHSERPGHDDLAHSSSIHLARPFLVHVCLWPLTFPTIATPSGMGVRSLS
jgi:hypothetical protein